jgi:hypothetical protein
MAVSDFSLSRSTLPLMSRRSSPITRDEFFQETFEPLYAAPTWTSFTYDRIALLFAVMAVGVLLDLQLQAKESWNFAYRFHKLAGGTLGMSEYM